MRARGLVRLAASVAAVAAIIVAQQLPADAKTTHGQGTVTFDDRQVVQLTRPGAERGRGGLALHLTSKDQVIAGNLAVATTTCDNCHATAISFQVVIADKAPTSLDVGNAAVADNSECAFCDADAFAYQFVLAFNGDARITGSGRRQLQQVDAALRRLARSGASADDIQTAVDGYAAQVDSVLSSELQVRPVVHKKVLKERWHGPRTGPRPPDAPAA
jgi:hypothetical protein